MNNILEVTNVTKSYPGFLLDNINICLPKGCIMGLIGENGAGKTTLIKLILDIVHKDSGTIEVLGDTNISNNRILKEYIGTVFCENFFYERLTAKEISNIMKNIYQNWNPKTFFHCLKRFQVPEKKIIKEFSRGMKMKLSIAIALSHGAKLLLLDEAMSGLDPVVRSEILDIFLEFIMDEENSILISSHITSDLEKICDYITYLKDGKVLLSDNKDTLLTDYGILKCGIDSFSQIEAKDYLTYRKNQYGYEILVKNKQIISQKYRDFIMDTVDLEQLLVFFAKGEKQ